MDHSKKILLVEGDSDKSFFEKICKKLSLDTIVQVAPPKDLGGRRNSKEAVFQRLEILLKQLAVFQAIEQWLKQIFLTPPSPL